jgi:hypothetical protein
MSARDELHKKLSAELETADWTALKPHFERAALVVVSEELNFLDTVVTVAEGNLTQVEAWMKKGMLTKPSKSQLQTWEQNSQTPFCFLIVQPWVFVQIKGN